LNCSDIVVFVVFVLLRQCGICCFWIVPTLWYLLFLNCSDIVVFVVFELFRQCGICCFCIVTTLWYLLFLYCYDSVVFVVFPLFIFYLYKAYFWFCLKTKVSSVSGLSVLYCPFGFL
jgi:hypothetical protein